MIDLQINTISIYGLLSIIIQLGIIAMVLLSIRAKESRNDEFIDKRGSLSLKGICCMIIAIFHCPTSRLAYNILPSCSHFVVVALFSFLSGYGIVKSYMKNVDYSGRLLRKTAQIGVIYAFIMIFRYVILKNEFAAGGVLWVNVILLFYLTACTIFSCISNVYVGGGILAGVWLVYSVVVHFIHDQIFGWSEQSIGFVIGILTSMNEVEICKISKKKCLLICAIAIIILIPCSFMYLKIHDPSAVSDKMYLYRVVIILCSLCVFSMMSTRFCYRNIILEYLGGRCLYVFLLHGMFIKLFEPYLLDGLLQIMVVSFSLLVACILQYITDKVVFKK